MNVRINLTWEAQGEVSWDEWWTNDHGYTRTHIPNLSEHISFANFDLSRVALPLIQQEINGDLYIEFDPYVVTGLPRNAGPMLAFGYASQKIMAVVGQHGFNSVTRDN